MAGNHHMGKPGHIKLVDLILIPEEDRHNSWLKGPLTSTSFADAWTAEEVRPYVPHGARALYVWAGLDWTGNGSYDYGIANLRRNGSSETVAQRIVYISSYMINAASGATVSMHKHFICTCDFDGIIEYRCYGASGSRAASTLYLTVHGYWM